MKMIKEILDFLEAMNKCKEISDEAEQKLINFFKGRSYYDCVSRESVIEYIKDCDAELMHDSENEFVREDIMDMPTVLPTHGTCKDCEHWCHFDGYDSQDTCKLTFRTRHSDFYCADFAKRICE